MRIWRIRFIFDTNTSLGKRCVAHHFKVKHHRSRSHGSFISKVLAFEGLGMRRYKILVSSCTFGITEQNTRLYNPMAQFQCAVMWSIGLIRNDALSVYPYIIWCRDTMLMEIIRVSTMSSADFLHDVVIGVTDIAPRQGTTINPTTSDFTECGRINRIVDPAESVVVTCPLVGVIGQHLVVMIDSSNLDSRLKVCEIAAFGNGN